MVTDEVQVPQSRRAVLAAAFGAVAATAAQALGRPSAALATNDLPIIQGQTNTGSKTTVVSSTASVGLTGESHAPDDVGIFAIAWAVTGSAFGLDATSNGPGGGGVQGHGHTGVRGYSSASGGDVVGVLGQVGSPAGAGVRGDNISSDLAARGVIGTALAGSGVHGFAGPGDPASPAGTCGVHGECNINAFASGVRGLSTPGVGVYGQTATGIGVAGKATSPSGTALAVTGKAKFTRSGVSTVATGKSEVVVTGYPLTSSSFVLATIQGAGESGLYLRGVVRDVPNNKFTIKLSKAVTASQPIAWFIGN